MPDTTAATAAPPSHPAAAPRVSRGVRGIAADLREIVTDLVHARELLQQLTIRDLKLRYKQAVMGLGWALFMPLLVLLSGIFVRVIMARLAETEVEPDAVAAIAVKALPWSFFVGTISTATGSLTNNTQLVTKVYFPREVLPLSAAAAQTVDLAVASVALAIGLAVLHQPPSAATLLWVVPLVALLLGFTGGMALLLSCANLFFRDVKYIVQVLLTFGVFFTPVFFDADMLGTAGRRLVMLNPLSPLLEGFRVAVIEGHNLALPLLAANGTTVVWQPADLVYSATVTVVALLGGALLFHRSEFVFAEYV